MFAAIVHLMDIYDEITAQDPEDRRRNAFLILATSVAQTPEVPIPELASEPAG